MAKSTHPRTPRVRRKQISKRMWGAWTPSGYLMHTARTRIGAIRDYMKYYQPNQFTWRHLYRLGARVRPVTVTWTPPIARKARRKVK